MLKIRIPFSNVTYIVFFYASCYFASFPFSVLTDMMYALYVSTFLSFYFQTHLELSTCVWIIRKWWKVSSNFFLFFHFHFMQMQETLSREFWYSTRLIFNNMVFVTYASLNSTSGSAARRPSRPLFWVCNPSVQTRPRTDTLYYKCVSSYARKTRGAFVAEKTARSRKLPLRFYVMCTIKKTINVTKLSIEFEVIKKLPN